MPRKHASSTMLVKNVRNTTVPANQRIAASSKNRIRKLIRNRSRYARRGGMGASSFSCFPHTTRTSMLLRGRAGRPALGDRDDHFSAFGQRAAEQLGAGAVAEPELHRHRPGLVVLEHPDAATSGGGRPEAQRGVR